MNFIRNNIALKDLAFSFQNYYSWMFMAYFDLKLKYRKTSSGEYEQLRKKKLISCIYCNSISVKKTVGDSARTVCH